MSVMRPLRTPQKYRKKYPDRLILAILRNYTWLGERPMWVKIVATMSVNPALASSVQIWVAGEGVYPPTGAMVHATTNHPAAAPGAAWTTTEWCCINPGHTFRIFLDNANSLGVLAYIEEPDSMLVDQGP